MIDINIKLWHCFALMMRYWNTPVNIPALQQRFFVDENHNQQVQIIQAARYCGLKCRYVNKIRANSGNRLPLPAIIILPERCVILLAIREGEWLIQDPAHKKPEVYIPDADGHFPAFLFTRRFSWENINREFNLRWFASAFLRYKKLVGEVLLASFFIQILALITPLFFQVIIDKVLTHQSLSTLNVLATGMVAIALFDVLLNGLRNYQLAHTSQRIDVTLSAFLYKHLLALPLSYFKQRQVGLTVARVHELQTIREFFTGNMLTLCLDLLFTLLFFIIMAFYSLPLTLIVASSLLPYSLLSLFITPILRRRLNQQFQHGAKNQAFLVESITGMETIKSMAVENIISRRWDEQAASFVSSSFKTQNLGNIAGQVSQLVSKLTGIAILWFGAHQVIAGEMTVGALIAFNMFAGQVTAPVLRLVQLWQDLQQVAISVKRLGDILNVPTETQPTNTQALAKIRGAVRFHQVSFSYHPNGVPAIKRLTLSVSPGEVIGVVGYSGSGKSTLTRLIQRLYTPGDGQIFIDDIDIVQADPQWLRRQIGVVLQETQLFNGTIRDNIALAIPEANLDQVISAAKTAGAHDFITALPQGYDTPVGEHGGQLSGGQKQRIGIARVLITQPRIVIFDEATSALDYESEAVIQQNMPVICRDRTVFIVAHRLSSVQYAQRIIVMNKGEIVEQGSPQQLLQQQGLYARLVRLQSQGSRR